MSNKKGNRQFSGLRKDIYLGNQIFLGYPHRRHRKNFRSDDDSKVKKIEELKINEFNEAIKKSDFENI
ncbi:MAG: hypothetical protein WCX88_03675 [Patescibacteria group bacterium]|jgi:hypothetical protein